MVVLYQDYSNYAPGVKTGHAPGVTTFLYREILENLLIGNRWAGKFDIWYVTLYGGPLPRLFKLCPWGQSWPRPGGRLF